MKKLFTVFMLGFIILSFNNTIKAQSCDMLYFCVKYDGKEVDCADRFTAGKITVMAKLSKAIFFTKVFIQADKYNPREGKFEYYKDYEFDTDKDMDYIYFNNVEFKDKGIYRVFLLDPDKNTITSALVEII
ncbi:MAG TPA: hypothetical protein VHO03_10530 [Ignavibacteriales bacterium]|nr:hypothetical protein [Ignavibacteriales bacterium]